MAQSLLDAPTFTRYGAHPPEQHPSCIQMFVAEFGEAFCGTTSTQHKSLSASPLPAVCQGRTDRLASSRLKAELFPSPLLSTSVRMISDHWTLTSEPSANRIAAMQSLRLAFFALSQGSKPSSALALTYLLSHLVTYILGFTSLLTCLPTYLLTCLFPCLLTYLLIEA